jgi:hypothetical protein
MIPKNVKPAIRRKKTVAPVKGNGEWSYVGS